MARLDFTVLRAADWLALARSPVAGIMLLVGVVVTTCVPAPIGRPGSGPVATDPGGSEIAVPALDPTPTGPTTRPSFIRPTPTALPTFRTYVVKRGDTLTSIALVHGTTARSIAFWNRAAYPSLDPDSPDYSPNRIEAGWVLLLIPDVELDPEDLP